eukprot:gene18871-25428_t
MALSGLAKCKATLSPFDHDFLRLSPAAEAVLLDLCDVQSQLLEHQRLGVPPDAHFGDTGDEFSSDDEPDLESDDFIPLELLNLLDPLPETSLG